MFPHERSLVKRMAGKPFVLLGVYRPQNPDERELVKRQLARGTIAWRSWWDEQGMVADQWGVQYFPGIYLIDAKGVLRHVGRHGLDDAIDRLVAEAEKESS